MGCSAQSVPSLSNVALRSPGETKSGEPFLVTFSTNATIAFLGAVSFHDGSGSADCAATSPVERLMAQTRARTFSLVWRIITFLFNFYCLWLDMASTVALFFS